MQLHGEPRGGIDFEPDHLHQHQNADYVALRVLATWIAQRAGVDPEIGAPIDRDFVVAQAHD